MSTGARAKRQPRLRAAAEARLAANPARKHAAAGGSGETLLHELQVHQIELEMQNETLRQSQADLEASRDRFVNFYEFAPVGYLTLNDQGLIADLNLTAADLLKADRTKILRHRFAHFVAPGDLGLWHAYLAEVMESGEKQDCELALRREDGSRLDVRLDCLRLAGQAPSLRMVMIDVSRGKRVERALAESEERFSRFMDTLPAMVFIKDADDAILYTNRRMSDVFGVRALLGRSTRDVFPAEFAEQMIADDRRALEAGYLVVEESLPDKDGKLALYQTHKFIIPRPGQPPLLGGIALDITARKQAERQLREMAESLEQQVVERTTQIRKLAGLLTMAEERERHRLAQDLHDNLGQLLAVIKIKLSSLQAGSLQPGVEAIASLVSRAEALLRVVTAELSPPILHTLGLGPALEWLGEEMQRVYGLSVHLDYDECSKPLDADLQAVLYRAVRELLINVARHAGTDQARISLFCGGERLMLAVSDAGCGFDPTGHTGIRRGHRSFGLRSIHERITNLGGTMEIDSSPGNGTTITLSVPCSPTDMENCDDPHHAGR